ncbi:MAG: hypothetical protein ACRCXZ_04100 [Patescibacteria group bacterium]
MKQKQTFEKNEPTISSFESFVDLLSTEYGFEKHLLDPEKDKNLLKKLNFGSEKLSEVKFDKIYFSAKFGMYIYFDDEYELINVANDESIKTNTVSYGIFTKGKKISEIKNKFKEIFRNQHAQKEQYLRLRSSDQDRDPEYLKKVLKGSIIYRYGVPKEKAKSFKSTLEDRYQSQFIIATSNGISEELKGHFAHEKDYKSEQEAEENSFVIHEVYHALAVPLIHTLCKNLQSYVFKYNRETGTNQSFTVFYEMLVEGFSARFSKIRGVPSDGTFNLGLVFGETIADSVYEAMGEEEAARFSAYIKEVADQMYTSHLLAKELLAKDLTAKKDFSLPQIVEEFGPKKSKIETLKALKDEYASMVPDSQKRLSKESRVTKWTKDRQRVDELRTQIDSDIVVNFDFSQFPGLVNFMASFDLNSITHKMFVKTNDFYLDIKSWEDSDFKGYKPSFLTAFKEGGKNIVTSGYILDSFKFWYNSLPEENQKAHQIQMFEFFQRRKKRIEILQQNKADNYRDLVSDQETFAEQYADFLNLVFDFDPKIDFSNYSSVLLSSIPVAKEYNPETSRISSLKSINNGPVNLF